jgi:hypothetical protein
MGTAALLGPEIADDPADAAEDFEPAGDDDGTLFDQWLIYILFHSSTNAPTFSFTRRRRWRR